MEKDNILKQMAQYDFSTPINVTMIFEDSDEETLPKDDVKEDDGNINCEINNSYINDQEKSETTYCERNFVIKNVTAKEKSNNKVSTETQESIDRISTVSVLNKKDTRVHNPDSKLEPDFKNPETTAKTSHNVSTKCQQINGKKELTTYVKDLLNTLSEHLILIMRVHYQYKQNSHHLNKIKEHFFDLSYSTVISLILPQENNETFIKSFIDKTVSDANEVLNWKCGRTHVESLLNEIVEYAKRKKAHIKTLGIRKPQRTKNINENRSLKEKLAIQPSPNISHSSGPPLQNINNTRSSNTDSTCIFYSGSPGREVTINVDPNTLMRHGQQNNNIQEMPVNKIQHTDSNIIDPAITQTASRQAYNDNRIRHSQYNPYGQKNTIHHKPVQSYPLPPPYNSNTYDVARAKSLNLHHSVRHIQENIQFMQYYHKDINHLTRTANTDLNFMNNVANIGEYTPMITSVTTLNPVINLNGRCHFCGKYTSTKCSKCNNISYCSYLCQELDSSTHGTICG